MSQSKKIHMSDQEFAAHMDQLIPSPSIEINNKLLDLARGLWFEMKDDLYHTFSFISRHFTTEVLQSVYDLCGAREGDLLPWDLIGTAIYLQAGTPPKEIGKAEWKEFSMLSTPESPDTVSSLATCTVRENGAETRFYTLHFGQADPQKLLDTAMGRASKAGTTVMEALQNLDYNLPEMESLVAANKAILGAESKMTEKLFLLMPSCPVTAAHITLDVDKGTASVETNPLWENLRDTSRDTPSEQTQTKWPGIDLDPQDFGSMCRLMDAYGDSSSPFPGKNELGEEIWISIFPEKITTRTHQHNGWVRLNTYWRDGTCEETFDGKWKSHERTERLQER